MVVVDAVEIVVFIVPTERLKSGNAGGEGISPCNKMKHAENVSNETYREK